MFCFNLFRLAILSLFIGASIQRSTVESDHYTAAVLEYNVIQNGTYGFQQNVDKYLEFIHLAANKSADIIVFPEMTIRGPAPFSIPNPEDRVILCGQKSNFYDDFLKKFSCTAYQNSIYVVINLEEKLDCTSSVDENCKKDEVYVFNTNVVFDRHGAIIDRYRKINLFGEAGKTPSPDKAMGVFTTDFGVTFGHFICFDILFQNPAINVLQRDNIKNIIFPTMWFSELPFLTAVQIQEGYAYANDVNLLAAGANLPAVGSTGSGIYSGKAGAIVSLMSGRTHTQMLIADVPKIPGNVHTGENSHIRPQSIAEMDQLRLKQDRVTVYNSQLIEENTEQQIINLSYRDTECTFDIKLSKLSMAETKENNSKHYIYRAIAFNDVQTHGNEIVGELSCSIIACTSKLLSSCGTRFADNSDVSPMYSFSNISIIALIPSSYKKYHQIVFQPTTVLSSMIQLSPSQYLLHEHATFDNSDMSGAVIFTNSTILDLYTFGLWARDYRRDTITYAIDSSSPASEFCIIPLVVNLAAFITLKFVLT